jgi:phosphocarrier protein
VTRAVRVVDICNARGLHARASAKFVKLAAQFDCEVRVSKDGQTVDAQSIMGLMMLAAGPGCALEIAAGARRRRRRPPPLRRWSTTVSTRSASPRLAAQPVHQQGGPVRLALQAAEVDRLAQSVRARARRADADQPRHDAGHEGDVARPALGRIEFGHDRQAQVAVDVVQLGQERPALGVGAIAG